MTFRITMTIVTALAAVLLASGSPQSLAATTDTVALRQQAEGNQRFNVSGTVAWVSYASNTVGVTAAGQNVEILMTPTTAIENHGQSGSISDIRRGRKISASGVVHGGKKVALTIVLK